MAAGKTDVVGKPERERVLQTAQKQPKQLAKCLKVFNDPWKTIHGGRYLTVICVKEFLWRKCSGLDILGRVQVARKGKEG